MADSASPMHCGDQGKPALACETCGNDFTPRRSWSRFCNDRCRNAFHAAETRLEALKERAPQLYQALAEIARETGTSYGRIAEEAIRGLKPPESPKALLEKGRG